MTRTIDESIAGADLTIPTANDFFGVGTGALPNGQDSLIINPSNATNPDYRATVTPPTMSPNILKQAGSAFSLSMWVKQPVGVGSQNKAASVFKLQNSSAGNSAGLTYPLSCYVQMNINGLFNLQLVGWKIPQTAINNFPNPGNTGYNGWVFGVFRIPAPGGTPSTYIGGGYNIVAGSGTVASGTETFDSGNKFAFGRNSDSSTNATYDGLVPGQDFNKAFHIGKLTFHDHLLTLTECQSLYLSMVT